MIDCVESHTEFKGTTTKNLLELTGEYSRIQSQHTKIHHISVYWQATNGNQNLKITFYNSSSRMKYLGVNLNKHVEELYAENDKTPRRNKQMETYYVHEMGLNIVKMSILPKLSYRFYAIAIKNPNRLFFFLDIRN